jgi:integrase
MATGIIKRHSEGCRSRAGGGCNCDAGWEAWVYLRRERKKVRKTFSFEAEAKSWRADALVAANRGRLRPIRRDPRTLAEALDEFVGGMRAGSVRPKRRRAYKPNTIRSYERSVVNHLRPSALGALAVAEVRRSDVQEFADELLGRRLAPGTVSNVLNPVQAFYRRAMDRGQLAHNPAERIDLPSTGNGRPRRIASATDAAALLSAVPDGDRGLWATAFYAGLRRGELMALRCADVDLGASLICVERSWDEEEGAIDPKSESSRRTVPLLATLRDHLDEHLLRTGREGQALAFGRTATLPFAPMAIGKRAKRAWKTAGVEAFMGHSKIQTTFDVYGHLMPGSHDEVRVRMDAYLAGAPPQRDAVVEPAAAQAAPGCKS